MVKNDTKKGFTNLSIFITLSILSGLFSLIIIIIIVLYSFPKPVDPNKKTVDIDCSDGYKIEQKQEKKYFIGVKYQTETQTFLVKDESKILIYEDKDLKEQPDSQILRRILSENLDKDAKIVDINPVSGDKYSDHILTLPNLKFKPTETEFKVVSNCLVSNKGQFVNLPSKIIFGRTPEARNLLKNDLSFTCKDGGEVLISSNGKADYYPPGYYQNTTNDYLYDFASVDKNDRFGVYVGKINNSKKALYDNEVVIDYKNSLFKETNLKKDLAERFYNKEGVTNDYLKTCTNANDKTIFDIFK